MKIPHASSIVACIDGYAMTLKGKTGLALFTAGFSSFIGGTVAIVVLAFLAPSLGEVAFLFGPADYCALMLVGFVCVSFVTTGSLLNGLAMCMVGGLVSEQLIFRSLDALWGKTGRVVKRVAQMIVVSPLIGAARVRDEALRALWCVICCLVLGWPLVVPLPDYTQGPVLSREQAAALHHLKEYSPPESVVWNWWDWGYATHHFAQRTTIADGARHGGPSLYLPAAVYTAAEPRFARQIIKYTALKGNNPGEVFDGLSATGAPALMDRMADPATPLVDAPGKQYIVVSFEMMRLGLWVTRYGSWNFTTQETSGGVMSNLSPALEYNMNNGQILAKNSQPIYADSIDVFSYSGLERRSFPHSSGYHFIFNPLSEDLKAHPEQEKTDPLARFWKWVRGSFVYTAMGNDKLAVNSDFYNTMMVQLMLCPKNDPRISPYFSLVYDNVYTRVYEVK